MAILYHDVLFEIFSFQPGWHYALVCRNWRRAWKDYIENNVNAVDLSDRVQKFVGGRTFRAIMETRGINLNEGNVLFIFTHMQFTRQARAIIDKIMPAGINPHWHDRCDSCSQLLSHIHLRDYSFMFGNFSPYVTHALSAPVELRGVFNFAHNDPCQHEVARWVLCPLCIRREMFNESRITNLYEQPISRRQPDPKHSLRTALLLTTLP